MRTRISGRGGEKQLLRGRTYRRFLSRIADRVVKNSFLIFFPVDALLHWWWCSGSIAVIPSSSLGLRNPPRPLLVASPASTGSSDSDGGLFAVPTTLPPNSRHGKLFFPNKETELTFRQHLSSISVSGLPLPHPTPGCQAAQVRTGRTQPSTVSPQMQSDFFLPKPRKLRNRHLRKPLVVQVSTPPTCAPP